MHLLRSVALPSLLLLVASTSYGQTASTPPTIAEVSATPDRLLLKLGLNAARSFRNGGYFGIPYRLPVSAGLEYALNTKFTLYGQLEAEFLLRHSAYLNERAPLIPTAAASVGVRYCYNQAGRVRHNRAHGLFNGNYLAVELHTEMGQRLPFRGVSAAFPNSSYVLRNEYTPSLNILWGLRRRLGRNFLFDSSVGLGVGPAYGRNYSSYRSPNTLNFVTQLNVGVYFGR